MSYLKHMKANLRVAAHAQKDVIIHLIHGLIPGIKIKHFHTDGLEEFELKLFTEGCLEPKRSPGVNPIAVQNNKMLLDDAQKVSALLNGKDCAYAGRVLNIAKSLYYIK